jgi:hypothetical protein
MVSEGTVRNPYFGGGIDVNYLLNPGLSLGIGASYKRYLLPPYNFSATPLYEGIAVNLGANWHVGAGDGSRIEYSPYIQPIFPLFYSYYCSLAH